MHMIDSFSLCVIRLQFIIRKWPRRREATVMFDFAKVLFAETEQRRAIKLGVATDIIIGVWMQLAAVRVAPKFFRVVAATCIHLQGIPILFLARNKWPALEQKNLLAARGQMIRQSATARARTDNDKIVIA